MPNPSSGKVKVRCPVCKNIFTLEATGKEFIECQYCGNSLKLPRYLSKPIKKPETSLPRYREAPSGEIQLEPINIRNSRPLIQTIVFKDIHGSLKFMMMLFLIGIVLAIVLSPIANTAPDHDRYLDELEQDYEDPEERAAKIEAVETENINYQFGIALFFAALIFIMTAQTLYGTELKKGTIRSIALYPIDMNGITVAKIVSISLMSGLILFSIFLIPVLPFYFSNTFPNLPVIIIMAYFVCVVFLIVTAFASHIPIHIFKNVKFAFNRLIIIFTIISMIFTETALKTIGAFYIMTSRLSGAEADTFWENWTETARGLAVISPYHGGGRVLTSMLGFNTGGFDFFLIGPIALILLIFGVMMGKKIYLDVFI